MAVSRTSIPGYEKVTDEKIRAKWAHAWGAPAERLSNRIGSDNYKMVLDARAGKLKAMYVIGEETAISDADSRNTHEAFTGLEFFVVQDLFLSRTAEFADVVLPACAKSERTARLTNTERRIQRFYQRCRHWATAKPDWWILNGFRASHGARLGLHPSRSDLHECAGIAEMFAGVSYERLEGWRSQQWPVKPDGSDTPLLYTERFKSEDGRARLHPLEWKPPGEAPDPEYDPRSITGGCSSTSNR